MIQKKRIIFAQWSRVTETKYTFYKIEYIYIEIYFLGSLIYFLCMRVFDWVWWFLCWIVLHLFSVLHSIELSFHFELQFKQVAPYFLYQWHNIIINIWIYIFSSYFYTSHVLAHKWMEFHIFFSFSLFHTNISCKSFQKYSISIHIFSSVYYFNVFIWLFDFDDFGFFHAFN